MEEIIQKQLTEFLQLYSLANVEEPHMKNAISLRSKIIAIYLELDKAENARNQPNCVECSHFQPKNCLHYQKIYGVNQKIYEDRNYE